MRLRGGKNGPGYLLRRSGFAIPHRVATVMACLRQIVLLIAGVGILAGIYIWAPVPTFAAGPPKIEEEWVSDVSSGSATLHATINPEGNATAYRFEYAASEAALLAGEGEVLPAPPLAEGDAGAGSAGVPVEAPLQDLQPKTTYWYRVVATDAAMEEAVGCKTLKSCLALTTQSPSGESVPSDGRVWELVSPPVKDGALIGPIGESGMVQAADDGGAIAYLSIGPAKSESEEQPSGNAYGSQILSVRQPVGGWLSGDIATSHEAAAALAVGIGEEYQWFSPDLSLAIVEPLVSQIFKNEPEAPTPLSPGASERTIYVRDDKPLSPTNEGEQTDFGDAELEAADPEAEAGYLPLVTGCPSTGECGTRIKELADIEPGTKFGGLASSKNPNLTFLNATHNARSVILYAEEPLIKNAGQGQLYEWTVGRSPAERLRMVSVLPKGEQAEASVLGGGDQNPTSPLDMRGAISNDGSRVIFTYDQHLYMRDMASVPERTVELDAVQGGVASGPDATFQFATSDGSKVFFTDGERLTSGSNSEPSTPDLYECEMMENAAGELECKLTDLTTEVTAPTGAGVKGYVAVGDGDSSYMYFVATGVLTEEKNERKEEATTGANNLYMLHYDEETKQWDRPVFIAKLSRNDFNDWGESLAGLEHMTSRTAPDGGYFAFMSERSLTGYDNRDASAEAHGASDEEVYLYRAPVAGAPDGGLVCVSCNPTGERPSGVRDSAEAREGAHLLVDQQNIWSGTNEEWLAGSVPGWTAMAKDTATYQSRYLSDEGRVFFDSPDGLVPQATNGLEDVYEYEPLGVGGTAGCTAASSDYSERSGGCVNLISSGSSSEESAFLDASENGDDVFFLTSAKLVPEDRDTAFDVYDAHVCDAQAPCVSEVATPLPCSTAESCRLAPAAQPSIYGEPSSATFAGEDNPPTSVVTAPSVATVTKPAVKTCSKGKRLSHGECVKRSRKRAKRYGRRASLARHKGRHIGMHAGSANHERRTGR